MFAGTITFQVLEHGFGQEVNPVSRGLKPRETRNAGACPVAHLRPPSAPTPRSGRGNAAFLGGAGLTLQSEFHDRIHDNPSPRGGSGQQAAASAAVYFFIETPSHFFKRLPRPLGRSPTAGLFLSGGGLSSMLI